MYTVRYENICSCMPSQYNIIQIIKAGTTGECLFFIASGSVCVTSTNGQALCHLEDGDYFGEIAFILKNEKVYNWLDKLLIINLISKWEKKLKFINFPSSTLWVWAQSNSARFTFSIISIWKNFRKLMRQLCRSSLIQQTSDWSWFFIAKRHSRSNCMKELALCEIHLLMKCNKWSSP